MAMKRAFQRNLRDKDLLVNTALAAAASTTVAGTPINLGAAGYAGAIHRGEGVEAVVRIPALNATMLPDTRTHTFSVETSDDPAFGSGVVVLGSKVMTGAGGAGSSADELRVAIPSDCKQYVRAKGVTGASTADSSAASMEFALVI